MLYYMSRDLGWCLPTWLLDLLFVDIDNVKITLMHPLLNTSDDAIWEGTYFETLNKCYILL